MNSRYIDWIWHVRGSVPLAPGQSGGDALDRLDPLFRQYGTSHERERDTLTFRKKDQAAQDKMSVFDNGVLRIDRQSAGPVLRYDLVSRTLLFCFLAPLLFLAFAQFTTQLAKYEQRNEQAGKAKKPAKKPEKAAPPLNPIDKFLGAPAPETKKEKEKEKADAGGGEEGGGKKPSPTPAYVFAAIFATLYVVGRVLEDRLVRSLFRKSLLEP